MSAPRATDAEALSRQRESLWEVIESVLSELELRPLLTAIVRHACELLGAERGSMGLVDEERNVIRIEAAYHMPATEIGDEVEPGVGLAGHVLQTRRPVVLSRYGDLAETTQAELAEDAVVGVPIFWRGQMIGFCGLGAAPPRRFDDADLETLALFTRHAAIAIENARLFEGTRRALAEMHLLYETSRRISTAMDVDEVIAAYLEQVAARGRYACNVALYERGTAGQRTAVVVRGRWSPDEGMVRRAARHATTHDTLDPLLDAGQTVTIADVHTDPRVPPGLRAIQQREGRPALAMIPLIVRGERIGLVVLSSPSVHTWREADLRPYQVTAAQLAAAVDSRQQQGLLNERGQQLAVWQERHRIARELHDSVSQLVFSITLIAQAIAPAWKRDPAEGEQRVGRLLELCQSALFEMRAFLADLRPAGEGAEGETAARERGSEGARERGRGRGAGSRRGRGVSPLGGSERVRRVGLAEALREHGAETGRDGLQVVLDAAGYVRQCAEHEEALFRMAQEALHNVVKHANAQHAEMVLHAGSDSISLRVVDDGIGFAIERAAVSGGLGLLHMRERAVALGGTFRVVSEPGVGTTVEVMIPRKDRRQR